MKKIKRKISYLLAVCMMLAVFVPVSATTAVSAEDMAQILNSDGSVYSTLTELSGKTVTLTGGQTFKLLTDVGIESPITVKSSGKCYIDGGAYRLTSTAAVFSIEGGSDVTVIGGSFFSTNSSHIIILTSGTVGLTVNGGYFYAKNRSITSSGGSGHTITVNGGTFVSDTGVCIRIDHGTVNLNGGDVYAKGIAGDKLSYGVAAGNGTVNKGKLYRIQTTGADGTKGLSYGELRGKNGINLLDGAAVRLVGNENAQHGIRFTTKITPELITYVNELKDNNTELIFGTLLIPTEKLSAAECFTADALRAAGLRSNLENPNGYDYAFIDATENGITGNNGSGFTVRCALVGLKNSARDFSAVAYVKYIKDGHTVYAYGTYDESLNSRSMTYVAFKALSDKSSVQENGYDYLVDETYTVKYGNETAVINAGEYIPYKEEHISKLREYVPSAVIELFEFFGQNGINGYKLVIPEDTGIKETRFAKLFAQYIKAVFNYDIPIISDAQATGDREIYVGITSKTQTQVGKYEYAVVARDGCLELAAVSIYSFENMLDYVCELVLDSVEAGDREIEREDVSSSFKDGTELVLGKTGDLRIMYHNVWGWSNLVDYDKPISQANEILYDTYLEYAPDILCLQEVTSEVKNNEDFPLVEKLCKDGGYAEVEVDPVLKLDGIYYTATPILYRPEILKLLDSGRTKFGYGLGITDKYLQESEGPDKWATYAVFEVLDENGKGTGTKIGVISVHLSEKEDNHRLAQIPDVLKIANDIKNKYGCPVMMGGDINCTINTAPHNELLNKGFEDVWMAMDGAEGREDVSTRYSYPTFNEESGLLEGNFNAINGKYKSSAIDHIFCYNKDSGYINYKTFDVVTDNYVMRASDHAPILLDFDIFSIYPDYTRSEYSKNY